MTRIYKSTIPLGTTARLKALFMEEYCVMCGSGSRDGVTDSSGNFQCKKCLAREEKARG